MQKNSPDIKKYLLAVNHRNVDNDCALKYLFSIAHCVGHQPYHS